MAKIPGMDMLNYSKSTEGSVVVGALTATLTAVFIAPKVNEYIDGVTGDARLTGVVDVIIAVGLFLVSAKLNDGLAVIALGAAVGFGLEGVVRVAFPVAAANAASMKGSATASVLASYL